MPNANVEEHLEACKKRYQITEELAARGEDDSDAGAMSTWYNLDVGMLLAQNQRLRAALRAMYVHIVSTGCNWDCKHVVAARRALEQQP